ncbi:MAG TPA: hypothetical protein VN442_07590 [Bryobacteraceae bacterium]|nr:hypothetical protein [Bryobacteraceae bacterium]
MQTDLYTKAVLTAIAALLAVLAFSPLAAPRQVQAQDSTPSLQFDEKLSRIEAPDGSASLLGRIAIDRKTGNIYGFPTDAAGYPRTFSKDKPAISRPILLGRFDLGGLSGQPLPE